MGINRGVNKVILIGNVGKDPEVKHLDNGNVMAKFPLATSEVYKNKENEKVTSTEWHNIIIFSRLAEIVEKYVKKGDALYLEGRIRTRSYEDKDGVKKYIAEIIANNMQMLGGSKGDNNTSGESNQSANEEKTESSSTAIPDEGDDLPF
ncbi:MAG: single-stranded DNA-binding protein [Bacteroidales bacterium]